MVYESIDHGNDVTCQAVPVVLVLVFHKNNFTPQKGQRRTKSQHMGRHFWQWVGAWSCKNTKKKNTKNNNKKNVASRSLRETSQETKNKCHCKKQIDHRQFSMVHTLIDHRNDTINCSKLCSETTRLRLVIPPLEFLNILWRHFYGL